MITKHLHLYVSHPWTLMVNRSQNRTANQRVFFSVHTFTSLYLHSHRYTQTLGQGASHLVPFQLLLLWNDHFHSVCDYNNPRRTSFLLVLTSGLFHSFYFLKQSTEIIIIKKKKQHSLYKYFKASGLETLDFFFNSPDHISSRCSLKSNRLQPSACGRPHTISNTFQISKIAFFKTKIKIAVLRVRKLINNLKMNFSQGEIKLLIS